MICQYLQFFMEYFIRDLPLQQLLYSSENHCRWSETSRRFYIGHWFRILEGGGFFPQKELQMFCFDAFKQSLQSCCWGWETEGERPGLSGLQLQDHDGRNMWRFWTFHLSIGLKTELSGRFLCRTAIVVPYFSLHIAALFFKQSTTSATASVVSEGGGPWLINGCAAGECLMWN